MTCIDCMDSHGVPVEYPIWLWAQEFIVYYISQAVSRSQHPDSAPQGRTWLA
jgi:hypothetical protein